MFNFPHVPMSKALDAAKRANKAATATLRDRVLDWTGLDSKLKPGTTGPEQTTPPPRAETEQHWENIRVEEASHNTKRLNKHRPQEPVLTAEPETCKRDPGVWRLGGLCCIYLHSVI